MADWLTPKLDWAAEDGVMNTDFNRIEGNIQFLYDENQTISKSALHQNITVYVSTTGSDTTGNGTQGAPFRTVSKALQGIPKNLNGYSASIYLYNGTYNEDVTIRGYYGGYLTITGAPGSVTLSGLSVVDGSRVRVESISLLLNGSLLLRNKSYLHSVTSITASGGTSGVTVNTCSELFMDNTITVNNTSTFAIHVSEGARAILSGVAGSGNNNGIYVTLGGFVSYNSMSLTATTARVTTTGGRIYTGAQTSAPNY